MPLVSKSTRPFLRSWDLRLTARPVRVTALVIQQVRVGIGRGERQATRIFVLEFRLQCVVMGRSMKVDVPYASERWIGRLACAEMLPFVGGPELK